MEKMNENQILQKTFRNMPKKIPEQLRELEKKAEEAKKRSEEKQLLGPYHLLPLLKGWEYKTYESGTRTVTRGADPIEVIRASNDLGWLQNIMVLSTDCYGGVEITYQGSDLQPSIVRSTIQYAYIIGAVGIGADPLGFVQLYYRPVPTSTYGAYVLILADLNYGNTLPYLPTVIARLYLESTSTQTTAEMSFITRTIKITSRVDFIRSLRKVLGTKNMVIDPSLLQVGRTMLSHLQGEEWKMEVKE